MLQAEFTGYRANRLSSVFNNLQTLGNTAAVYISHITSNSENRKLRKVGSGGRKRQLLQKVGKQEEVIHCLQ